MKRIYLVCTEIGRPLYVRLAGIILLAIGILLLALFGMTGLGFNVIIATALAACAGGGMFLVIQADELDEKQKARRSMIETYYDHQEV